MASEELDRYAHQPCFICGARPVGMRREAIFERFILIGGNRKAIFTPGRWVTFCDAHRPELWRRGWGIPFNFWLQVLDSISGQKLFEKSYRKTAQDIYNANLHPGAALREIFAGADRR
jgi:hypothetical protein